MVNNFDRIFAEIAARAPHNEVPGLAAERLIELLLEAVDLEDRNRVRSISRINATLEERVRAVALEARRAHRRRQGGGGRRQAGHQAARGGRPCLGCDELEIENFAVFDRTVLEPSTDPERPLTVIRAENGSGKTTFLRALLWGMYGEKGLPGERKGAYSVHPAWWEPCAEGVGTRVAIEFDTDGSTRYQDGSSGATALYRLERSVRTISRPARRDDEPDFQRVDERASLMKRVADSGWKDHRAGADAVIEQLLPWELRDFFVMDADEATDFAGGAQSRTLRRELVERKTTDAVRSLLGIEVFEATTERLRKLASRLGREATRAIGSRDLDELQKQQDELDQRRRAAQEELRQVRDRKTGLQSDLESCREALTGQLMLFGAFEGPGIGAAGRGAQARRTAEEPTAAAGPFCRRTGAPHPFGGVDERSAAGDRCGTRGGPAERTEGGAAATYGLRGGAS